MDVLEPRADDRMHGGIRALHRRHCSAIALSRCLPWMLVAQSRTEQVRKRSYGGRASPSRIYEVVEGQRARTILHQEKQRDGPYAMCVEGVRIDEDLDHQRHQEKSCRGETRTEAGEQ